MAECKQAVRYWVNIVVVEAIFAALSLSRSAEISETKYFWGKFYPSVLKSITEDVGVWKFSKWKMEKLWFWRQSCQNEFQLEMLEYDELTEDAGKVLDIILGKQGRTH